MIIVLKKDQQIVALRIELKQDLITYKRDSKLEEL